MRGLGLSWLWVLAGTSDADLSMSHAACFYKMLVGFEILKKLRIMEAQHPVSQELERFMQLHSILSLDDLLAINNEDLLEMDGFGWKLMKEVLDLRVLD